MSSLYVALLVALNWLQLSILSEFQSGRDRTHLPRPERLLIVFITVMTAARDSQESISNGASRINVSLTGTFL